MTRPLLTVLTSPVPTTTARLWRTARQLARPIVKPGVPLPHRNPYPGHFAVVRSVVEGLREIGADFNFNPDRVGALGRAVYAPENASLRQAAEFKRRGQIDYLVAGPVNALYPDEYDGVLLQPEIDRVIVACDWMTEFYRDAPEVAAKSRVCACGVDARFWQPTRREPTKDAVVYWKSGDEAFCEAVEQTIRDAGLVPRRVRSAHGEHEHFTREAFRSLLDGAAVGVFLSAFETQGIALAEAWAMDVPTLAWDPRAETSWRGGRPFVPGSSAPYLTAATGRLWRGVEELGPLLRDTLAARSAFQPRAWVLAHMTDAICAAALYDIIRDGIMERDRDGH